MRRQPPRSTRTDPLLPTTTLFRSAEQARRALIALAHGVADAPGAVATMPSFPPWGFALAVFGGLWMLLWQTRWRRAGAVPLMIGIAALLAAPRPDLLVTGDARHIAARSEEHTSELQSLMRSSYAVFCLKTKNTSTTHTPH